MGAVHHDLTIVALVVIGMVGMLFALERPEVSRARTLMWMAVFVAASIVGLFGVARHLR